MESKVRKILSLAREDTQLPLDVRFWTDQALDSTGSSSDLFDSILCHRDYFLFLVKTLGFSSLSVKWT